MTDELTLCWNSRSQVHFVCIVHQDSAWVFQYTLPCFLISLCITGHRQFVPFVREALCGQTWSVQCCDASPWNAENMKTQDGLRWVRGKVCLAPCSMDRCGCPRRSIKTIESLQWDTPWVSSCLEGLPKAEVVSGYLISYAGFLFHEHARLPLNSHELLASMTRCGKALLSITMCCLV